MDKLDEILSKYKGVEGALIPVLQEVQEVFGYLPKDVMVKIAKELKIPASKIYSVVTFYAQFYLTPHGKYTIRVCRGTACHVQGSKKILSTVKNITGLKEGETSQDLKFTLETVTCLGVCALSPVMMINKDYFGKMTPKKATTILHQYGGITHEDLRTSSASKS
ncbi:TPA: NADH-quinone oxidoreductase subunit NuoE [bacterium]|nr:NADH-quinone oxidoreductase subunit NuoE [bacterium]